jgi:NAD(P)-dependent dehydrogenase (short-subunit alcohol dehydrogenase family)
LNWARATSRILINKAALYPHLSTTDQNVEVTLLFNVNVWAPFILAALVPQIIRQANGVIINLGSIAGLTGLPTTAGPASPRPR